MLKLQYFGQYFLLMWRADSLEKTLMLGKTERGRRGRQQQMRWWDAIVSSADTSLSKVQETVKDREARRAAVHGVTKSRTWMSEWATTTKLNLTAHSKGYTPRASGVSTWNARTIQCKKINTIHHSKRMRQKSHHHLNWCRKSTWQNWTPFIIKTLNQIGREENYLIIVKVKK